MRPEHAGEGARILTKHGRVRFVISMKSNDGEMRFMLLRAIESGL
jgi:serine-type D-Ala-D-Ala carboxypeptidase/endopeptidase (penicillin-binding protein 4)